ncbi:hypothetical protein HDE_09565 [Halotydeus destructor]|nr:hypothetical protein HDE_09565 [Halotydeus destructor]
MKRMVSDTFPPQRSDIAVCGTVLSSFTFAGIVPGHVVSSLTLKVHSQVARKVSEHTDVLSSIEKLPLEFIMYLIVAVHLVAGIVSRATKYGVWQYLAAAFKSLRFFVSQGDLSNESNARAGLWLNFSVFAFVTVFGYFLNLMSTDTFVLKQERRIDTFEDIFDPYFREVRFTVAKNDLFFNFMQQSDRRTNMGKIYRKMERESDCSQMSTCSLLEFDGEYGSSKQQAIFQIVKDASVRGGAATFLTEELLEAYILPCLCRTQPDIVGKLYTAPLVFAEDIMVNSMRADLDRHLKRYFRYIDSSQFESHLVWIASGENIHSALDLIAPGSRDLNYLHCKARRMPEEEDILFSTGVAAYKRLAFISIFTVLCAGLVLLVEIILLAGKRKRRRQRRKMKRIRQINDTVPAAV